MENAEDELKYEFDIDDWNSHKWILSDAVQKHFGLSFTECFKKFDFCRTASWNEEPLQGQCIKCFFRLKLSSGAQPNGLK